MHAQQMWILNFDIDKTSSCNLSEIPAETWIYCTFQAGSLGNLGYAVPASYTA